MGIIYRKTAKGINEIQTRVHRLPPRSRSLLILVDGQRSDDDLLRMVQNQAKEALETLVLGGFIEAAGTTTSPALPASVSPPPSSASPAPIMVPRQVDVALVRREAVRRLNDLVGPDAEDLCIRIERCKDLECLRPLLASARQLIGNVRGPQVAAEYISALSAL